MENRGYFMKGLMNIHCAKCGNNSTVDNKNFKQREYFMEDGWHMIDVTEIYVKCPHCGYEIILNKEKSFY
jgi:ribosomal protein S27E